MTYAKNTVRRVTLERYRGRLMCIEVGPDGVFVWPKGTRQRVMISLSGAWEKGLSRIAGVDTSPAKKQIGMSARKRVCSDFGKST